jgi:hypothetical protein
VYTNLRDKNNLYVNIENVNIKIKEQGAYVAIFQTKTQRKGSEHLQDTGASEFKLVKESFSSSLFSKSL